MPVGEEHSATRGKRDVGQHWNSLSWPEIRRAVENYPDLQQPEQEYAYVAMCRLLEEPTNCLSILRSLPDLFFSTPRSGGASRQAIDELTRQLIYVVETGQPLQQGTLPDSPLDDANLEFVLLTLDALVGAQTKLVSSSLHDADFALPEPRVRVSPAWLERASKLAVIEPDAYGVYRPAIVAHVARISAAVAPRAQELIQTPVLEALLRTHDATLLRYIAGYGETSRFPKFPIKRFFPSHSDRVLHQWADGARSASVFLSGMTEALYKQSPELDGSEAQETLQEASPLLRLLAAHGTRSLNVRRGGLTNKANNDWTPPSSLFDVVKLDGRTSLHLARSPFLSRTEQSEWGKCIGARQMPESTSAVDDLVATVIFYAPAFIDETARLQTGQEITIER